MIEGPQLVATLEHLGVTDVAWLPDSALGPWEHALESSPRLRLIRVCREGEAWAVAAGLHLAGRQPLVMIQNTGLFESGDALRNVLFDLGLPLWALIGYRSYLVEGSADTARKFTEPVLAAWGLPAPLITTSHDLPQLEAHLADCRAHHRAGVALIAEGRM